MEQVKALAGWQLRCSACGKTALFGNNDMVPFGRSSWPRCCGRAMKPFTHLILDSRAHPRAGEWPSSSTTCCQPSGVSMTGRVTPSTNEIEPLALDQR
jgi:hypothetical protein